MAMNDGKTEKWRKFLLPGAASVLGAGAGLVLTRTDKLRGALPNLSDVGVGDLTDDLRTKLSSVVGGGDSNAKSERSSGSSSRTRATLDGDELQDRLKQRQERRRQRAGR